MSAINVDAIEGADHMTRPIYDKDGWYVATITDLIERVRELERELPPPDWQDSNGEWHGVTRWCTGCGGRYKHDDDGTAASVRER